MKRSSASFSLNSLKRSFQQLHSWVNSRSQAEQSKARWTLISTSKFEVRKTPDKQQTLKSLERSKGTKSLSHSVGSGIIRHRSGDAWPGFFRRCDCWMRHSEGVSCYLHSKPRPQQKYTQPNRKTSWTVTRCSCSYTCPIIFLILN